MQHNRGNDTVRKVRIPFRGFEAFGKVLYFLAVGIFDPLPVVKDLVTGSGIEFESRGLHALKGVPDEWQIYAVV